MMEYLGLAFEGVIIVLLVLVIVKLHQVPAAVGLVKSGSSTLVADLETLIAKHKAAP